MALEKSLAKLLTNMDNDSIWNSPTFNRPPNLSCWSIAWIASSLTSYESTETILGAIFEESKTENAEIGTSDGRNDFKKKDHVFVPSIFGCEDQFNDSVIPSTNCEEKMWNNDDLNNRKRHRNKQEFDQIGIRKKICKQIQYKSDNQFVWKPENSNYNNARTSLYDEGKFLDYYN